MSKSFGKRKKKPEQHTQCFLAVCNAHIDEIKGAGVNKKCKKKFTKYMNRMIEIMNGNCPKCLNTTVRIPPITLLGQLVENCNRMRSPSRCR